jgi:hypothetical protein
MLQQERLVCFRRQHLAGDQAAFFRPAPRQVRLQEAEALRCVEGVYRSQDLIAMEVERPCWIAKRRNVLRRALAHGWFSATSVWVPAGEGISVDPRIVLKMRFKRWRI